MKTAFVRAAFVNALLAFVALVPFVACKNDHASSNDESPSTHVDTPTSMSTHAATDAIAAPTFDASSDGAVDGGAPKLACRAIAVVGPDGGSADGGGSGVAGGGAALLKLGDLLAQDTFVDLASGAKLTAKHPRTSREVTVVGPAHARFCVGYEDETWLATGTFKSAPGSGEAPGTESWVVTPWGVIRYASGAVTVKSDGVAMRFEVTVTNGAAYVWSGAVDADAGAGSWQKVTAGGSPSRSGGATHAALDSRGARAATSRCKDAADEARSIALAMTPDGGPPQDLGTLASAHVVARKAGRAACSVAQLRVALLPDSDVRTKLAATLEEASHWADLR